MKKGIFRWIVLVGFFVLFTIFSLRHFIFGGGVAPSVDALCPFGGFETLLTLITSGGFVPRILMSSLILGIGVVLITLVFRRGFCGYICPFGTVQEILGKFRKKKLKVKPKIDRKARYLKYFILLLIMIGTYLGGYLVFRNFDPFQTFFHFGKGIFWEYEASEIVPHMIALLITVGVLALGVFVERFWCKYLCPFGAGLAIFSKFGLNKIVRDDSCIDCKKCDKICPVDVKVSNVDYVKNSECINCNKCIDVCPKNSLSNTILGTKISNVVYGISVLFILALVIMISMNSGIWQSVQTLEYSEAETMNPESIKGWMTLTDISEATGICLPHFLNELGLPIDVDVNIPIKMFGDKYGIDFHAENIREYVKNFEHSEDSAKKGVECPWSIENDPSPGKCGLYVDSDGNRICDLSE